MVNQSSGCTIGVGYILSHSHFFQFFAAVFLAFCIALPQEVGPVLHILFRMEVQVVDPVQLFVEQVTQVFLGFLCFYGHFEESRKPFHVFSDIRRGPEQGLGNAHFPDNIVHGHLDPFVFVAFEFGFQVVSSTSDGERNIIGCQVIHGPHCFISRIEVRILGNNHIPFPFHVLEVVLNFSYIFRGFHIVLVALLLLCGVADSTFVSFINLEISGSVLF